MLCLDKTLRKTCKIGIKIIKYTIFTRVNKASNLSRHANLQCLAVFQYFVLQPHFSAYLNVLRFNTHPWPWPWGRLFYSASVSVGFHFLKPHWMVTDSPSLPFFHVSSHNQGEAQGDTLLICNPGYSTQTLNHLPLAFNWKPQCTGVIMAKQVPYVHTGPTQSDTNKHTQTLQLESVDEHKLTDAHTLIHHTHSSIWRHTHKHYSLYGWIHKHTPCEGCNGMLINAKPLM